MLASMLGELEAKPQSVAPSFTNIGVKTRRTPGGALSCRPIPFPESALLEAGSPELAICIENSSIRASQPRKPDAIRELEDTLAALAPNRGIFRVPFARPGTWTLLTIRSVIEVMIAHLPPSVSPPSDSPKVSVWLEPATDWKPYIYIGLSTHGTAGFHAEVRLSPDVVNVLAAWPRCLGNRDNLWRGPLEHLDDYMRSNAAVHEADPPQPARPPTSVSDDYRDDDDLDPIERAARRTLRGGGHFQQQAAPLSSESEDDAMDRIADKLAQLPAVYAGVIEGIIDRLIEQKGGR
jgi:hypothetical protein